MGMQRNLEENSEGWQTRDDLLVDYKAIYDQVCGCPDQSGASSEDGSIREWHQEF